MNYTLLFISAVLALVGCTKAKIQDSLINCSDIYKPTAVAILPGDNKDKKFSDCLKRELKEDLPYLKVIPEDTFRDALFPWFERSTAPEKIGDLSVLLNNPMVRKRIEDLGIELLIYVHGITAHDEYSGFMILAAGPEAVAVLGYTSSDRKTHISTTVWNLKESVSVGGTDVHVEGKVRWLGLIIPVPIPAFTEREACSETAERISNCIAGNVSPTNK